MSRLETIEEKVMSEARFALRILPDDGDDSETTTLPRFVSHSLRCGNHYITTTKYTGKEKLHPVVAMLLPPLSECIPGAEIRISLIAFHTYVVPATDDEIHFERQPQTRGLNCCIALTPDIGFLTLMAVPQLSKWMMEGVPNTIMSRTVLDPERYPKFFLSKTQSEHWPVSWTAESSEL